MKNNFTNTLKLSGQSLHFTILVAFLFVSSCKKDNLPRNTDTFINTADYQVAQQWFNQNEYLMNTEGNWLKSFVPNWNEVNLTENSAEKVYEIALINPENIFVASTAVNVKNIDKFKEKSLLKLIVIENKESHKFSAAIMEFAAFEANNLSLSQLRYKNYRTFSGAVNFYKINGQLANGWIYKEGKLMAKTESALNLGLTNINAGVVGKGKLMLADAGSLACGTRSVAHWRKLCVTIGEVEGWGYSGSGTTTSCRWEVYHTTEAIYCQALESLEDAFGGGGGYTGGGSSGGNGTYGETSDANYINNFVIDYETQAKYPKFTTLLKDLKGFVKTDTKVLDALKKWSGFSEAEILSKVEFGQGPKIIVKELTGKYGYFNKAENPNIINIDAGWVRGLESANLLSTRQATGFLLAVTILHEFVHQARASKGLDRNLEYGVKFENSAFGLVIESTNAGSYSYRFYGK